MAGIDYEDIRGVEIGRKGGLFSLTLVDSQGRRLLQTMRATKAEAVERQGEMMTEHDCAGWSTDAAARFEGLDDGAESRECRAMADSMGPDYFTRGRGPA